MANIYAQLAGLSVEENQDYLNTIERKKAKEISHSHSAVLPGHLNLTGVWMCDDGGMYYIRQTGNTLRHNTLSADEANRNKTLLKLSTLPDWQVMPASELTPPVLYNRRSTENPNMNTNDTVLDWLKSKQNQ